MKIPIKILLINLAVTIGLTVFMLLAFGFNDASDFMIAIGLSSLVVGGIDLFLSLIFFAIGVGSYDNAKGFLLSGGILIMLGFTTCGMTSLSFH